MVEHRVADRPAAMRHRGRLWSGLAAVEVASAVAAVVADRIVPTLVLLALAALSLAVRREPLSTLGWHRVHRPA
jgi:hypothetical protein